MGNTFEQVTNETVDECVVLLKPTVNDSWQIHPSVFPNQAAAVSFAQAKVGNPDNYAKAQVMTADGPLFKDTE